MSVNEGYVGDSGGGADQNYNVKNAAFEVAGEARDKALKWQKLRIGKNVVVISFAFMLLFTAFQSMANLQSSINSVSCQVISSVSNWGYFTVQILYSATCFVCTNGQTDFCFLIDAPILIDPILSAIWPLNA